jgi:undecaprenyl-diphosphatase|tara:strand:- start:2026 stop:2793 length:768 start_codon:yes stop_codon:yes gene_type:complete
MISDYLQAIFLAFVQGVSEFIPVSSSAHLVIFSEFLNFNGQSLIFDVGLHLGSLIAIIFFFRNDLLKIKNNKKLLKLIIIGSLPLIIFGYYFISFGIINILRNIEVIGWSTLVFGLLLYYADSFKVARNLDKDLNTKNILIIGMMQVLSLMPGVSRSGIIITVGRLLNFNREDSVKISFFLSIPALLGASIISIKDVTNESFEFNILLLISILVSFIFSYLTIKYLLIYVQKFSMKIFVVYRIILSFFIFFIIYT